MIHPRDGRMSHRALMVRAVRTRRWPWFLLAGIVLAVGGGTLLGGVAQAMAVLLGVGVFLFAVVEAIDRDDYYRPEPPLPPPRWPPTWRPKAK